MARNPLKAMFPAHKKALLTVRCLQFDYKNTDIWHNVKKRNDIVSRIYKYYSTSATVLIMAAEIAS